MCVVLKKPYLMLRKTFLSGIDFSDRLRVFVSLLRSSANIIRHHAIMVQLLRSFVTSLFVQTGRIGQTLNSWHSHQRLRRSQSL